MVAGAALVCGFIFGWGLLISGMVQPAKVLAFLDILGAWDASLAVVMGAALAVSGLGFALIKRRQRPLLAAQLAWPGSGSRRRGGAAAACRSRCNRREVPKLVRVASLRR